MRTLIICMLIWSSPTILKSQELSFVWKQINVNNGLIDNLILDVDIDTNEDVWILSSRGLDLFRHETVINVFEGEQLKGEIFRYRGQCYLRKDSAVYLCAFPFNHEPVREDLPMVKPGDPLYSVRDGYLMNESGQQVLDKRIVNFKRYGQVIFAFTNYDGVFWTDTKTCRILNLHDFEKEKISDLACFNGKLYIAAQSGKIFEYDNGQFRYLDFKVKANRSPGKFFSSDSAVFCYTGKIDLMGNLYPYRLFYYCFDLNDTVYLQLGHKGFNFISRKKADLKYYVNMEHKINSFAREKDLLFLFGSDCYYQVDLNNRYKVRKIEKPVRVSHRNTRTVVSISDDDTVRLFQDFGKNIYRAFMPGLKAIKDVYVRDSFLFVFSANAFVLVDMKTASYALPVYYADIGMNNKYEAAHADDSILYITDGNNLIRYAYSELLSKQSEVDMDNVSELRFSYVHSLPCIEDHVIMKKFSYAVLYKDTGITARTAFMSGKFIVSKLSPGLYRLVAYDKYGNILFSSAPHRVSCFYLVCFWLLAGFVFLFFVAFLWLLFRNYSRVKHERFTRKDMAYNISLKQKLSVSIPHLYNNLFNSILAGVDESDNDKFNSISEFSSLMLKYNARDEISLTEELVFCNKYFELYAYLKSGLKFYTRISNTTAFLTDDIMIPTFMIQPVLENSFKRHQGHSGQNSVFLCVTIRNNCLELLISDDFSVRLDTTKSGGGVGLKIIDERMDNLRKKYKEKVSISWAFRSKKGFYTKMSIPYEKL